jgi:hypothetical protein
MKNSILFENEEAAQILQFTPQDFHSNENETEINHFT